MQQIVFLHGLNSSATSFRHLEQQLPAHEVHLVNYASHQPLAASIRQVLEGLPDGPITIVGHSLGGLIGVLIAADRPDRVQRLVTISSPFGGSRAAIALRWFPGSLPVLHDIVPTAAAIVRISQLRLPVPTLSIVSTGGHLPSSPEPNDSVVSVSSQRALGFGRQVEVRSSHFEVLLADQTASLIRDFLLETS